MPIRRREPPLRRHATLLEIIPASCARRGTLLVEMVVCTVLLSVLAGMLVPGIRGIHRQRQSTRFETLALIELNNLAARLQAQPDSSALKLAPAFAKRYPAAKLQIDIGAVDDGAMQPMTLTISQPSESAAPDLTRSLTTWRSSLSLDEEPSS